MENYHFILTKKFCVYVDFIEKDGEFIPGYVGKGVQRRVNKPERNRQHQNYAKKYDWKRVIGFETDDENEAFEVEKTLIRELHTFAGKYVDNTKDLQKSTYACNQTLGGDGVSGVRCRKRISKTIIKRVVSDITRQRIREARARTILRKGIKIKTIKLKIHRRPGYGNGSVVVQLTKDMQFVKIYFSIADAVRETKSNSSSIIKVCRGEREFAAGYRWHYFNEELPVFIHKKRTGLIGSKNPNASEIEQYTMNGEFIAKYDTIRVAGNTTNINTAGISNCCRKLTKHAGGFIWKYAIML